MKKQILILALILAAPLLSFADGTNPDRTTGFYNLSGTDNGGQLTAISAGVNDVNNADRPYLADIRQALFWIVGLQLVSLTVKGFNGLKF